MSVTALISNALELDGTTPYAAILGANPSAGARSPKLWNAAFAAHGRDWRMVPMDVTAENLAALLAALRDDCLFIGGAVAVPHKEPVAAWLAGNAGAALSPAAAKIGAVNSLYRDAAGGLIGTNTDGEGALSSLRKAAGDLAGRRIVQVGLGGAGKAIAAYVAQALADPDALTIAVRQPETKRDFAQTLGVRLVAWPPTPETMRGADVVINCTSIGARIRQDVGGETLELERFSPLAPLDENGSAASKRLLAQTDAGALVFDIIYDPAPTVLLAQAAELGRRTLNGAGMNLEQAVIAFCNALGASADPALTRTSMEAAARG